MASAVVSDSFGKTKDGHSVTRYTLKNGKGMTVRVLDYGATITEIHVPDKDGNFADVNLSFDTMEDFETKNLFFGGLIGRVANRIEKGQFTLDGEKYQLAINNGPNASHGGLIGFHERMWKAEVEGNSVKMTYVSPDGEEGFPGELTLSITFSVDEDNSLKLNYSATTNKATPLNLTSHPYFNLGGHTTGHLDDHVLTLHADKYLPQNATAIPTGELASVEGTAFDVRQPKKLKEHLPTMPGGAGFDSCFCLEDSPKMKLAARLEHPPSGRYLECHTTEPGLNVYSSFYVTERTGKGGATYKEYCAICLEAQHFPDSVNHPHFPNTILRPGDNYMQQTVYKFGIL